MHGLHITAAAINDATAADAVANADVMPAQ